MSPMFRRLAALAALTPALTPLQALALDKITLPEDSGHYEMNWSGLPGGYDVRYKVVSSGGTLYVCGNVKFRGHAATDLSRKAIANWQVTTDKGVVAVDSIRYFTKTKRKQEQVGSPAKCKPALIPLKDVAKGTDFELRQKHAKKRYSY